MRVFVAVALALCVLVSVAVSGAATPAPGGAGVASVGDVRQEENETDDDRVAAIENVSQTIEIHIRSNGDAEFTIEKGFVLEEESDRRAFERLARDFEEGEGPSDLSEEVFARLITRVNEDTEREMEMQDATRSTEVTERTGTLTLSFTWTNFARVDDDRIVVDDAFTVDGEPWIHSLSRDQRLLIHAPDGYAVTSAPAPVVDGVLRWEGPTTFDDAPRIRYVERGGGDPATPPSPESDVAMYLGAGLILGAIAALSYAVFRRHRGKPLLPPIGEADEAEPETASTPRTDDLTPSDAETDAEATPEDPFAGVDEELLSDEERVIRLLEANDGRMKQATIVNETNWSNAKVSQLLSAMDEAGQIDKLRIGRENLITLADGEETEAGAETRFGE